MSDRTRHWPSMTRRTMATGLTLATCPLIASPLASNILTSNEFAGRYGGPKLPGLRERAERKGLLIGTTFDVEQFNDRTYIDAISMDSNILVPGNGFNWTRTQPHQGAPLNFSEATPVYALAQKLNAKMRLHDLVYDQTTPGWVKQLVPTLTPVATERLLVGYINQVLGTWGSRVAHIEVVNEPGYDLSDPLYRPFVFAQKLGIEYLDIAYHTAHTAAPNALLFTNAAALEPNERIFEIFRKGMLNLLEGMLKRAVPIHAIGIEAHLMTDRAFSEQTVEKFFYEIKNLGLKFMITELDVNDRGIDGDIVRRDAGAAAIAKAFLDIAFSFKECLGLITWNGSDRYTWLHAMTKAGDGPIDRQRHDGQSLRPTPYDEAMKRKPLWYAIAAAIDGAPTR